MQLGLLRLTPAVRNLLFLTTGIWFLDFLGTLVLGTGRSLLIPYMSLDPEAMARFQIWRPLTYLFAHADFGHLFFNMLMLWMFGTPVEDALGSRRFYQLYIGSGLAAAVAATIAYVAGVGGPVVGASGATLGVTIAFCMLFPEAVVYLWLLIPIKARYLGILATVLQLVHSITSIGSPVSFSAHLGGILGGFLIIRYKLYWEPRKQLGKSRPARSRLRVVPETGGEKVTPLRRPEPDLTEAEKEVDRILDKLSREGMEALTPDERETLDAHSVRLRQRDGG